MPRTSQLQTNFNAGELSSTIDARVDFPPYFNGSLTFENFFAHPQGWAFRRKGLKFVAEVKDSTKKTIIIPFKFNISQVLIIELGAGYFRFYLNQAAVTSGGPIYELANSFQESDLPDIRYIQKDDVIYFTHPIRGIYKMIRIANNNWTIVALNLLKGPYMDENIVTTNSVTITGTYTKGGTSTLTATGGHTPFTSNHVGGLWRVRSGTEFAYLKITGFTSSTVVTCTNQEAVPASLQAIASSLWSEGEFSNARSFPRALTFHEARLVFAGSINATQRVWFSKVNDFENFETGATVEFGFNRTIAATSNDSILWLFSDDVLFIGTSESIWRAKASNNSAAMSNSDFAAKRQIAFGSESIPPIYADDSPFYLQRGKTKVRAIGYSASKDRFSVEDITIKSDHITGSGLTQFAYQQNPISTIYAIREDGQCACFVYESAQDVSSWSRLITDGKFESVAIIPSSSTYDEIYFIVNRTIGGVTKRYIEVIEPTFDYSNLGTFFVDSGLTYNGTKNTTLTLSSASGSVPIITESEEIITTEDGFALITEEANTTVIAGSAIFSAGDVGKQIHEFNGNGRASIITYISATQVEIDIIEPFSSISLSSGSWAIAVNQVGGLNHLIGKTVSISGDGATIPNKIVSGSGTISFDSFNSIIHAGLSYKSVRKSMPLEMARLNSVLESSQGKFRRIDTILISFLNSRTGRILDTDNNLIKTIDARSLFDSMGKAPNLENGVVKIDLGTDWNKAITLTIEQEEPQPMNIKSITYYLSVNDF